jgi:ubiquinone/menaquinone biosynthesis C-methylase UbiE
MKNLDPKTVASFGDEWTRFDQSNVAVAEARKTFEEYFALFPWLRLPEAAEGFDMGCGSGRWAYFVAPKVGLLHCIDPSSAIEVARTKLGQFKNVSFHRAFLDETTLQEQSQDFGYSLGVLHHVPDTQAAIASCVALLKPGAPFLLYIYYAFDHRPLWFRIAWRIADLVRRVIWRLPPTLKHSVTDLIALLVYWPLARLSRLIDFFGFSTASIPLSYYRKHSFYTMRTDSRDRFGTPLEKRFTREQIRQMMEQAGLENIVFRDKEPFWCAVGTKIRAVQN